MKAVGVICEYDPFHAGHAHLLAEAEKEGARVCLMSGLFTQRGKAALLPPHDRAAMALAAGADAVLELPYPYAAGSARYFAVAGVRALAALGCDTLAFGSETADAAALLAAAARLAAAEETGRDPAAGDAAAHFAPLDEPPAPNDILALEYLRAIEKEKLPLRVLPVLRAGAAYRDARLESECPSATALRAAVARGEEIAPLLPAGAREIWRAALDKWGGTADTAKLGAPLLARLRSGEDFSDLADCGGGLAAHLARAAARAADYEGLCRAAATKRYTDGRLRRAMLYLLTDVRREDLLAPPAYLRLLGANEAGREFLAKTRKTRTVPVVTKSADIAALGASAARQRTLEVIAEGLYALCLPRPTLPEALDTLPPVMV